LNAPSANPIRTKGAPGSLSLSSAEARAGVELAGALGEIANDTLRDDFRSFRPEEARILLLDAGEQILSSFPASLGAAAERDLLRLGVRCLHQRSVTAVDASGVSVRNGDRLDRIETRTVIWAAGVKAFSARRVAAAAAGLAVDRAGRIPVTASCTVPEFPSVFALGDMAACAGDDGQLYRHRARSAMQQGRHAARVVLARESREPPNPALSLPGPGEPGDNRSSLRRRRYPRQHHATGLLAWLLWLFIHLLFLVGFQNRLQVFLHWAFQYTTFNRNARLITANALNPPQCSANE
jgi:NADH dehydrogenase